ncbi:MAG: hypothetical protein ISS71_09225 [Phycisphaerae bacterium]|nr:hypothetical protein [Phycisphaerae bacterium]
MNTEAFLLCDAATDQHGKLNILGAFDNIFSKEIPVRHPSCSIASRIRFKKTEEGEHLVKISIIDADGNQVGPKPEGKIMVRIGDNINSAVVNLILNLQGIEFKQYGRYQIDLLVDGSVHASLPFQVSQPMPSG